MHDESWLTRELLGRSEQEVDTSSASIATTLSTSGQVHDVPAAGQKLGNLLCGFDSSQFHQSRSILLQRLGDQLGGFTLSLGANNVCHLLLLSLEHDKLLLLSLLFSNLLSLNSICELSSKCQVRLLVWKEAEEESWLEFYKTRLSCMWHTPHVQSKYPQIRFRISLPPSSESWKSPVTHACARVCMYVCRIMWTHGGSAK